MQKIPVTKNGQLDIRTVTPQSSIKWNVILQSRLFSSVLLKVQVHKQ